jgi:hypothetical protein
VLQNVNYWCWLPSPFSSSDCLITLCLFFFKIIFLFFIQCTNNNVTIYNQTVEEDYAHTCKVDKNNNTELIQAIDLDLIPQLTSLQIMLFSSYKNSMVNCIYKLHLNDYVAAHQCCIPYINNAFYNNAQPRGLLMQTTLWPIFTVQSSVLQLGTISGFCGCN